MADKPDPPKTLGQFIDNLLSAFGSFDEMRATAAKKAIDAKLADYPAELRKTLMPLEMVGGPEPVLHYLRGLIAVFQAELDRRLYD